MANSKELIIDKKEFRRIKTGQNISTELNEDGDIVFDLPAIITSTTTKAQTVELANASNQKSYLLGAKNMTDGQKPVYHSSVYMQNGTLYANAFSGNGNALTNINPANISNGMANINIKGVSSYVGYTNYSSGLTYLTGIISDSGISIAGEQDKYYKPNYTGTVYVQGDALHSPRFVGDGSGLTNVIVNKLGKFNYTDIIQMDFSDFKSPDACVSFNWDSDSPNKKCSGYAFFNGSTGYAPIYASDYYINNISINERLNKLGFKEGTITKSDSSYVTISNSTLTKLGNYVIGQFDVKCGDTNIGTIPVGFRPYAEKTINIYIRESAGTGYNYIYTPATMTFKTTGQIIVSYSKPTDNVKTIMFGWDTTAGAYS